MNRVRGISAALLCGASVLMGQNLITNPGFESSGSGWTLWTDASATEAVSAVSYPDSGAHSGTRYARVRVDTPSVENWHIQFQTPAGWNAVMGGTYDMTFWARSENSSSFHFSVQDGPDNAYTYRTGFDFSLSPEWAEYSFSYISDVEGTGALRFFLYLGATEDTYGFDDFNLTMTPPLGIRSGSRGVADEGGADLRVLRRADNLVVSVGDESPGELRAELFDLRGARVSAAAGRTDAPLQLALPRESGRYFVRAQTSTRAWVRAVAIP